MTMNRSNRPEVLAMRDMPREARDALERALRAVSRDFHQRGNAAWASRKPPLAAYWPGNAVHARHLAVALASFRRKQ